IGGSGTPNTAFNGGGIGHAYEGPPTTSNVNNSTMTIDNVTISHNTARNEGGGFYNNSTNHTTHSTVNFGSATNVNLLNNLANSNGGGISNINNATANLTRATVRGNVADNDNNNSGNGGGLFNGATATLAANAIIGGTGAGQPNSAVNGGGVHSTGQVTITGSSITGNTAKTNGGGIFNTGSSFSVSGGSISNNTATSGKGDGIEHTGASGSVSGATISNNNGSGISISGTGSLDVGSSTITNNTGDGITKIGTGVGSHFNSNTIHSNGELGIDLSDDGVTLNDVNDTDSGPNNLQNFPVINWVRRTDGIGNVTLNAPNGKYRIQYYKNAACDASGHGEGEVLMTSQVVDITTGNTLTFNTVALAFDEGVREQITATATHDANGNSNFDDDGSTSEFSACRKVNTLPTFTTVETPSRQQGSAASNSQIATVTDPDQTLNTLAVTVNNGASATVNGVTVSNIAVDASGNVTADIVADCTATDASFTLHVTDTPGESTATTLNVTVTTNTAPTVGNYSNTTVNAGSSGTVVTPDAAPADNGSIASVTASASPNTFTGTFVGNTTTGAVTINNAAPFGVYTVTVTVTDNCGTTTTTTFQLTVNATPTITGATISRQQGSASANSQIASANDDDQAENTLAVTVNSGASATVNGVTVSNIAIDASGNVTADVVADCTATNATFTLTVTDSAGASSNGTLTVNVTPNTAPTVGTYSNTNVNAGSGTTVTPSAPPADNGSIASATVGASGSFSGTLSVDSTTGVVTVSNANPVGSYTVTVTFTDNCGTQFSRQFTLDVVDITPPTTSITGTPTDPSGTTVSFSFTGNDSESGIAGFQCKLDTGAFESCTSPKQYTGLSEGSHTFYVRAVDNAGNEDPNPPSFTWNVDATAPETTITSSPPDPSNSSTANFEFTSNETGSTFQCKLDLGAFESCTSPKQYTGLSEGSHTFEVKATDALGNVEPEPASYTWMIDTTAPTVSLTSAASNPTNTSPIPVTAQFSENVTDFTASDIVAGNATVGNFVAVDGDTYTFDLTPGGQGTVTADIGSNVAQDAAGNGNTAATQFSRTFDSAAPTVAMSSAAPNPTNASPIPVTAQFSENVTDFTASDIVAGNATVGNFVAVDGDTYTFDLTPSGQGTVTANIGSNVAQDAAGNGNTAAAQFSRIFDSVSPSVAINQASGQADPTSDSPIHFTAVFSEPVSGFTNGDVVVSGTANPTTVVVTEIAPNNGTTFDVAVSGMNDNGTVSASIPANGAADAAGNLNTASTSTDNTVTFILNSPPTVAVAAGGSCSGNNVSGTINLLVADGQTPADSLILSAVSSNTNLVPNANIVFGGSGANRTLTVTAVPQKNSATATITITIDDGQGLTGTVTVTVIVGSNKKETINGTTGADIIFGLNGDDTINANAGNDLVCAGNGNSTVNGGAGDDTLDGGNGNDILRGEGGNDILIGGFGNDRLEGGADNDTLTGGLGADFFSGGAGTDTATDFNPGEGDTTDGTLALLNFVKEWVKEWAEE
ncbi:MAG TPA: Ig-like domain-containing protein, partial [Pyrinomonadaceae bacterium]|nr:Ig-like domain-containing protein [Pyrinomonadaceae bacterium]